mmetsp:Transcript_14661/g.16271  ORF Transcript_14661/g.16271 Transcript_14661/m.16271 type:complete len:368 (-) Transcript_14661:106-1209(-)
MICSYVKSPQTTRIDKYLKAARATSGKEKTILSLGLGGSGKSTFMKQMKIIYGKGFTSTERLTFGHSIHDYVTKTVMQLYENCDNKKVGRQAKSAFKSIRHNRATINKTTDKRLRSIWNDEEVQRNWYLKKRRNLASTADLYLLDKRFNDITCVSYKPTNDDILLCIRKTIGMWQSRFDVNGYWFHVIDMGGQASERRKWIRAMDNVDCIIFFVDLHSLLRPTTENSFELSCKIFKEHTSLVALKKVNWVVILNKKDLFEFDFSKHMDTFKEFFPNFKGTTPLEAIGAVEQEFFNIFKGRKTSKLTCITTETLNPKGMTTLGQTLKHIIAVDKRKSTMFAKKPWRSVADLKVRSSTSKERRSRMSVV